MDKIWDAFREPWIILGFAGQLVYTMRFLIQWIVSEREKKSVIPVAFWYFSIAGSLLLLVYAAHRGEPVFMIGQAFGFIVYFRNLHLLSRSRKEAVSPEGSK